MRLIKHPHAHLSLELEGQQLIIDPGMLSSELGSIDSVAAVVITHVHDDHCKPEHIAAIRQKNPGVIVFGTPEVADVIDAVTIVQAGEVHTVGPFTLQFFGAMHAVIHTDYPYPHNTGVLVNDTFYYPGDSFTEPGVPIEVLALPINAPWAKVQDTMDYLAAVRPTVCFPTHNGLLSDAGQAFYNGWAQKAADAHGIDFRVLSSGQSLDS
jgi:L-ascorbate metabolism protein UlaG (beta-lactamase superfamily)